MFNPKSGSTIITLFQLNSNYHISLDPQVSKYFQQKCWTLAKVIQLTMLEIVTYSVFKQYNSSSAMGGVCRVWYSIHRDILIRDY